MIVSVCPLKISDVIDKSFTCPSAIYMNIFPSPPDPFCGYIIHHNTSPVNVYFKIEVYKTDASKKGRTGQKAGFPEIFPALSDPSLYPFVKALSAPLPFCCCQRNTYQRCCKYQLYSHTLQHCIFHASRNASEFHQQIVD